ncbi:uncharacterized protein JCM6883_006466 [Sporobolomyces salmoneus]|uniref:uncharacterized protein n=1 Tax=Sporobolomyces salmoneus TaxID=183962 RepID=UPI00316FE647
MNHTPDPPEELDRPMSRESLPPGHFQFAPPLSTSRSASPFLYPGPLDHMQQQHFQQPPPPPQFQQQQQRSISSQRSQSPYPNLNPLPVQDTRTQLFVSNLPFRVRWQDLKDLMRKCGTVLRADVALSPTDGRSRGFGVVLFARAEDAAKAIGVYHGYTWQTRVLDVRIDSQDPTGAIALAEANRQQAIQQQREVYQNLASRLPPGSMPLNLPPPPPITQPLQHYTSSGGYQHVPNQPPPPSLQQFQAQNSPFLAPTQISSPMPNSNSPSLLPRPNSSQDSNHIPSRPPSHSASPPHPFDQATSPPPSVSSLSNSHFAAPSSSSLDHSPSRSLQPGQQQQQSQNQIPPPPPLSLPLPSSSPNPNQPFNYPPPPSQAQLMINTSSSSGPSIPGGLLNFYNSNGNSLMSGLNGGGPTLSRSNSNQQFGPGGPYPQQQGQGGQGQGGIGYTNRHLFIGNLPFNCQWQELKDLMRGAGSVLRADIAQGPDGRSRGFGSVLFATSIDAERAVQLFNGQEFQGRTLKVHFDKFSGAGLGQPGNYPPNGPGSQNGPMYGSNGPYRSDGPPPPQYPNGPFPPPPQQSMHQYSSPFQQQRESQRPPQQTTNGSRQQIAPQFGATSQFFNSPMFQGGGGGGGGIELLQSDRSQSGSRPGTAQAPIGSPSPVVQARQLESSPSTESTQQSNSTSDKNEEGDSPEATTSSIRNKPTSNKTSPSLLRQNAAVPSRITMPPPLPFHGGPGSAGPTSAGGGGMFSPMRTNLPPMTPSMPAFTFGGFSAPTPPVHPHALFSPGIGPFSPQIGSPFFGPGGAGAGGHQPSMNHFQTVAPGAPSPGFGFNPMFPAFPPTPNGVHPSQMQVQQQQQQSHQNGGYPINGNGIAGGGGGDHPTPLASQAPNTLAGDASYFPRVESEQRQRERTARQDDQHGEEEEEKTERPKLTGHSISDSLANDLSHKLSLDGQEGGGDAPTTRHHRRNSSVIVVGGITAQPGWAEEEEEALDINDDTSGGEGDDSRTKEDEATRQLKQERRKSFVPPSAVTIVDDTTASMDPTTATGGAGAGGSPGKLRVGEIQGGGVRRASFEDSTRQRPAFGTSIWG